MTGAVLLVGVAASAVTGCVTVRGDAGPQSGPGSGPSREDGPEPAGAEPRMGGPELREELSRPVPRSSGPRRPSAPGAGDTPVRRPAAGGPGGGAEGGGGGGDDRAGPPPAGAGSPGGGPGQRVPMVRPSALRELPGGTGVCDLGRQYGGWAAGSTPHDACERAYGG